MPRLNKQAILRFRPFFALGGITIRRRYAAQGCADAHTQTRTLTSHLHHFRNANHKSTTKCNAQAGFFAKKEWSVSLGTAAAGATAGAAAEAATADDDAAAEDDAVAACEVGCCRLLSERVLGPPKDSRSHACSDSYFSFSSAT